MDEIESKYRTLEDIHGPLNYTLEEFRHAWEGLSALEKILGIDEEQDD